MWEYQTISVSTDGIIWQNYRWEEVQQRLNELGRHGWELVSSIRVPEQGAGRENIVFFFKRPVMAQRH
jgi:hypothetical protein